MAAQEEFPNSPERIREPTRQAAATREKGENIHGLHPEVEHGRASSSGKRRNTKEILIWDLRPEKHETKSQGSGQDSKNHGMDTVEGSAPSKTEKGKLLTWEEPVVEVPASPERLNV
jgi:hypothetical protein